MDITIQVPRASSLELHSTNDGDIVVENVSGEIEVENVNGSNTLRNISGNVVVNTVNGDVTVTMTRVTPDKPMSFSSMNGDVDVTLPADIKANVKMKSQQGEVYSDFDITLKPAPQKAEEVSKSGEGQVPHQLREEHLRRHQRRRSRIHLQHLQRRRLHPERQVKHRFRSLFFTGTRTVFFGSRPFLFPAVILNKSPGTRHRLLFPVLFRRFLHLIQPGVIIREFRKVGQGDLRGQDLVVVRDVRKEVSRPMFQLDIESHVELSEINLLPAEAQGLAYLFGFGECKAFFGHTFLHEHITTQCPILSRPGKRRLGSRMNDLEYYDPVSYNPG